MGELLHFPKKEEREGEIEWTLNKFLDSDDGVFRFDGSKAPGWKSTFLFLTRNSWSSLWERGEKFKSSSLPPGAGHTTPSSADDGDLYVVMGTQFSWPREK